MSFSIMTQCLPGMYGTFFHESSYCASNNSFTEICMFYKLNILYPSGIVHIIGVHSDVHLGQREAQSLHQGVQGLPQPPDGHYPPDTLIVIKI